MALSLLSQVYDFSSRQFIQLSNFFRSLVVTLTKPIIHYGEHYVLKTLTDRALNGPGYAKSRLFGIVVVTRKDYIEKIRDHGEFDANHPNDYDPKWRSIFDSVVDFEGVDTLFNWHGDINISMERKAFRERIIAKDTDHNLFTVATKRFTELANNWPEDKSVAQVIHRASVDVIAEVVYGIRYGTLPEECYQLIERADHVIFESLAVKSPEFIRIKERLKQLNAEYVAKYGDEILSDNDDNYAKYEATASHLKSRYPERTLKDWNPIGSLVAANNPSALLTGIVLKIAENPQLQQQIREELSNVNWEGNPEQLYEALSRCKLLEGIYREGLRWVALTPPVFRKAATGFTVTGNDNANLHISNNSVIVIPISRLLHDPKLWKNPDDFDPNRQFPSVFTYPFTPFSAGKRFCPAGIKFAEILTLIAVAGLFGRKQFTLNPSQVVPPPRFKMESRILDFYTCQVKPATEVDQPKTFTPAHQRDVQLTADQRRSSDNKTASMEKSKSKAKEFKLN